MIGWACLSNGIRPLKQQPINKKYFGRYWMTELMLLQPIMLRTRLKKRRTIIFKAPSGGPLVQHSVVAMMEFYHQKKISLEKIVQKMAHNPAILFQIKERGFIREGYFADLVLVNPNKPWKVEKSNILAKCGWSPFEGNTFQSAVTHTWVSGHLAYSEGNFNESKNGERLAFSR